MSERSIQRSRRGCGCAVPCQQMTCRVLRARRASAGQPMRHCQVLFLIVPLALAAPPECVPLHKRCNGGNDCCAGKCIQKTAHYAQCMPASGNQDGESDDSKKMADESDDAPVAPVGSLEALADPKAWIAHDADPPCRLQRIAASGQMSATEDGVDEGQLLEWEVPSMSIEMKTMVGMIGVNICGAARLPAATTLAPEHGKPRDASTVACDNLHAGEQAAYLVPFELQHGGMAASSGAGCRAFGAAPATVSLLSRAHPSRGIELVSHGGITCSSSSTGGSAERPASVTITLRCDADAELPILKDATLKNLCDVQFEFLSAYGCAQGGGDEGEDGDEGEGGADASDAEDSESSEAPWSQCIGGESGCALSLLLDPECNRECASDECFWDNGACHPETMECLGCDPAWLADGEWCACLGPSVGARCDSPWIDATIRVRSRHPCAVTMSALRRGAAGTAEIASMPTTTSAQGNGHGATTIAQRRGKATVSAIQHAICRRACTTTATVHRARASSPLRCPRGHPHRRPSPS